MSHNVHDKITLAFSYANYRSRKNILKRPIYLNWSLNKLLSVALRCCLKILFVRGLTKNTRRRKK